MCDDDSDISGIPLLVPFCILISKEKNMQTLEFALTCHRIGKISMKNEGSDFAILPASLKPQKPNVLGYYIFKITSDLSSRWTYCRVVEWTEGDRDCYLPTVICLFINEPYL